jgi:hypothetical protein
VDPGWPQVDVEGEAGAIADDVAVVGRDGVVHSTFRRASFPACQRLQNFCTKLFSWPAMAFDSRHLGRRSGLYSVRFTRPKTLLLGKVSIKKTIFFMENSIKRMFFCIETFP